MLIKLMIGQSNVSHRSGGDGGGAGGKLRTHACSALRAGNKLFSQTSPLLQQVQINGPRSSERLCLRTGHYISLMRLKVTLMNKVSFLGKGDFRGIRSGKERFWSIRLILLLSEMFVCRLQIASGLFVLSSTCLQQMDQGFIKIFPSFCYCVRNKPTTFMHSSFQ